MSVTEKIAGAESDTAKATDAKNTAGSAPATGANPNTAGNPANEANNAVNSIEADTQAASSDNISAKAEELSAVNAARAAGSAPANEAANAVNTDSTAAPTAAPTATAAAAPIGAANQSANTAQTGSTHQAAPADSKPPLVWKSYQKIAFRIAFIFFVLMTIPENPQWYTQFFQFDWTSLHYRDLYDVARFQPMFIRGGGYYGYAEWLVLFAVAIVGGLIWTAADRKRQEYNVLYYWLTVIVRYRAAIGIIGFAFTKVLPVQMPYPSTGILNTNFGDLTAQKIYWLSISVVPWYQVFAGIVELSAGILLFFRKTATLGAIILFGALWDIVYVNFAYDGGVHVYSSYFVLFALFLLAKEIPKIYNLFILERYTVPVNFDIQIREKWLRITRVALKSGAIILFLFVFFYIQLNNFLYDPYKQPAAKGISKLRGYYQVSEFRINNQVIPYSPQDSLRWQEVTFEKWTTLTYKQNRPVPLDLSNGGGSPMRDINRTFEIAGVGGGRRVFYYEADTVNHILYLKDKYRAPLDFAARNKKSKSAENGAAGQDSRNLSNRNQNFSGDKIAGLSIDHPTKDSPTRDLPNRGANSENKNLSAKNNNRSQKKTKNDPQTNFLTAQQEYEQLDPAGLTGRRLKGISAERAMETVRKSMTLHYSSVDGKEVILSGVNENRDSVYMILHRIDKKYALKSSTLNAGKY